MNLDHRGRIPVLTMFENIRLAALDINGTLIDGEYHSWEWVFENGLGLRKRQKAVPLKWYEVQTGRLSFEDAVSQTYESVDTRSVFEEANRIYMADLRLRDGCIDLLEALRQKLKLVVCSVTSGVTKVIVKTFGLERYFSSFFYSIDIGWLKSDREFWEVFLKNFPNTKPNEFVMFGDNVRCDIHWPNFFGISTVQVKTTENLTSQSLGVFDEYDKATLSISNLDEFRSLVPFDS
jgi:FMN phosphatase YigB (HAD superfamily)